MREWALSEKSRQYRPAGPESQAKGWETMRKTEMVGRMGGRREEQVTWWKESWSRDKTDLYHEGEIGYSEEISKMKIVKSIKGQKS